MSTSRLEAFSDGVFAIAATLLVLELHVPPVGSGPLFALLLEQWPSYAGYVVSFLTIGIIWVNHHAMFAVVRRVDRPLLFLNLLLLMVIAVIPFPTAVVGQWITDPEDAPVAAALMGIVFLVMGLAFGAIWLYAVGHHELALEGIQPALARSAIPRFTIGNLVYLVGIGLAFVSPLLSLLLYALVAVYYVFPTLPRALQPHP
ncbi:MAG TPA: TMEM175 family protein [Chloroflexota bacterium]